MTIYDAPPALARMLSLQVQGTDTPRRVRAHSCSAGCGWGVHRVVRPDPCQLAGAQSPGGGQDVPSRESVVGSLVSLETLFSAWQE